MNLLQTCHVFEDGEVLTLENFLYAHNMRPEWIGLQKLDHFENCYCIYYDFTARNWLPPKNFRGLCSDEFGDLKTSTIPNDLVAIAILHYKK